MTSQQPAPLNDVERAYFDTILSKAGDPNLDDRARLMVKRMRLQGRDVAVIGADVYSRQTQQREGFHPIAILLTDETLLRDLRDLHGEGPAAVDPTVLDPSL